MRPRARTWYFRVVPSTFKTHTLLSVLTSHWSQQPALFWIVNGIGLGVPGLFGLLALGGRLVPMNVLIAPALLLAFGFVAESERIREFIQGPYLMPGCMYANQILLEESALVKEKGMLQHFYWYGVSRQESHPASAGETLFRQNCGVCHTLRRLVAYLDQRFQLLGPPGDLTVQVPGEAMVQAQAVYKETCSRCHGLDGKVTPFAGKLKPPPPDLRVYSVVPERAFEVISNGYPGTVMPAFGALPESVRWGLVQQTILKRDQTRR